MAICWKAVYAWDHIKKLIYERSSKKAKVDLNEQSVAVDSKSKDIPKLEDDESQATCEFSAQTYINHLKGE